MPTVTNLAVSVTARTADFNSKMQESAGVVQRFGRIVVGLGRRLVSLNSAMRVVKLVGITLATRYALKFADAIVVTARKVGLTNNELIGLQFAAGLAGVKITDLTKHLERMSPKLATIQDTLKGMGVKGGDLALMVSIIERLGLSMSQLQGKEVENAVAAVRRLWTVIKAVSLELAVRLAPAVKWVAKELLHFVVVARIAVVELAQRLQPYIDSASERLVQFATAGVNAGMVMPRSFGLIAEAGARVTSALALMEAAWHGLDATVSGFTKHALEGLSHLFTAIRDFLREIAGMLKAVQPHLPAGFPFLAQFTALNQALANWEIRAASTQRTIDTLARGLVDDIDDALMKMNTAFEKFTSGKAGADFKSWFADIAKRAAEVVEQILKLQKIDLKIPDISAGGGLRGAAARARAAEFQQISLARVAVQGVNTPGRPQIVRDPQLVDTNEQLRLIRTAISLMPIGLTS